MTRAGGWRGLLGSYGPGGRCRKDLILDSRRSREITTTTKKTRYQDDGGDDDDDDDDDGDPPAPPPRNLPLIT